MTLEQHLAVVEAELQKMKTQQKDNKDIAELMKKTITEAIRKERRPGGLLYRSERRENAAMSQAAIDSNVSAIIENAEANACQYSVRVGVNQVTSDNSKALASTQRLKLRFDVLSPVRDMRVAPDYEDRVEKSKDFSFGIIKTLYSKVHVSGFTDDENDRSTLTIHYVEDYTDKSTFSGVMTRAEEYARNYCQKLGLGAE